MDRDDDIEQILTLLDLRPGSNYGSGQGLEAARDTDGDRSTLTLDVPGGPVSITRTEARLLLFLEDTLNQWLVGSEPIGGASDLRWSVTRSGGLEYMEVRIGRQAPLRFSKEVAAASMARRIDLREFALSRS